MDERTAILQDLRERVAASAFHAGIGLTVQGADRGEVHLAFQATPAHLNLQGLVHGGMLATIADTAMGLAIRSALEPGRRHVTVELGIHYLRPARPGRLAATGRVVRLGSQVAFAEAEVFDHAKRLLARASGTFSVTAAREP